MSVSFHIKYKMKMMNGFSVRVSVKKGRIGLLFATRNVFLEK